MTKIQQPFLNAPTPKKTFSLDDSSSRSVNPEALERFKQLDAVIQSQQAQNPAESPTEGQKKQEKAEEQKNESDPIPEVTESDLMDFDLARRKFLESLVSEEQEKEAERRATPLDFGDLAKYNEFRQTVTIRDGLVVCFRTVSSEENLELQKLISSDSDQSIAYVTEKMTLYSLCCALKSINDRELPSHLVDGKFDKDAFNKKLKIILSWPIQLNAMLSVHAMWFDKRVRALFKMDTSGKSKIGEMIKNG